MEFKQVYTPGLAHCSYVIGGRTECIVVDPAREVDQYLRIAASFNKPITAVIETHLHADFVSGHRELAERTGASIHLAAKADAAFAHHQMFDGDEIRLDTLLIRMIETPGHTPESAVFLVADLDRGAEPALAFTGDTLLVGDAGRPDLFPDRKHELAVRLYRSLGRLGTMGDHIEVYPAHGAGSLCGRLLSSKLSSTIGTERRYNGAMTLHPEAAFVQTFLQDMPEAPDHFARCSEINRVGPTLLNCLDKPVGYRPQQFLELAGTTHVVVDTRDQLSFGAAHVPGAFGLSLKGNFATYSGWVLPPSKPLLLVLDEPDDLEPAVRGLRSVGFDRVAGYLDGGMAAYAAAGLITARVECISVVELHDRFVRNELVLVDTRLRSEWDQGHIDGAIHVPAPDLRTRWVEFLGEKPVAFICSTGNRSLLASSIMRSHSHDQQVLQVIGGFSAWQRYGFPTV